MSQVFISYSRRDLDFVERLANDLKHAGNQVWYDLSELDGGDHWGRELQNAIHQCEVFVLVVSPNSVESEWVEKEFLYASSLGRRIVPLMYQVCDLPLWLLNIHYIDVQGGNYSHNLPMILRAFKGDVKTNGSGGKTVGSSGTVQSRKETPRKGRNTKAVLTGLGTLGVLCVILGFTINRTIVKGK
jgi:hypothetical protein